MCFTDSVRALGLERTQAEQLAAAFRGRDLLGVEVQRIQGRRDAEPILLLSEMGGCACSLLADDAAWDADVWAMEDDAALRLARTLQELGRSLEGTVVVEALWDGDGPEELIEVSWSELVSLASRSLLGTAASYSIGR